MRKINGLQISIFLCFFISAATLGIFGAVLTSDLLPLGGFREISIVFLSILLFYVFLIAFFRLCLKIKPLKTGDIPQNSEQETIYHIYILFFLMGFYPLLRSGFLPLPVLRALYLALGAKLGDNTYSSGLITDPMFVTVGRNCILGQWSIVTPHAIENEHLSHLPIVIGDNVTIGASSVVLQGVTIGDHAIVASGSVVPKGTCIKDNEIWGGVPARLIKKRDDAPKVGG